MNTAPLPCLSLSNPDNEVATTYVQDYQSNVQESLCGLLQAQQHHVLCLSSNDKQTSGHFDKEVVGQQIQSMAIFETVDFMQCGTPLHHRDVMSIIC